MFGKPDCIDFIDYRPYLDLRSRIVWFQPSRLAQGRINYTNNYDVICYFIKGRRPRTFDLDAIRVEQLVELEHRLRCERVPSVVNGRFGKTKFNGNGKNPGDVWGDIKQLTYRSKELVSREALNTIQKPEKLVERLIKASSTEGDVVLDPFAGVGTCPVVCRKLGRRFIGVEKYKPFVDAANARLEAVEKQSVERLFRGNDIQDDSGTRFDTLRQAQGPSSTSWTLSLSKGRRAFDLSIRRPSQNEFQDHLVRNSLFQPSVAREIYSAWSSSKTCGHPPRTRRVTKSTLPSRKS